MAKISYSIVGIDTNLNRIHTDLVCDVFNIRLAELPDKKLTPCLEVASRLTRKQTLLFSIESLSINGKAKNRLRSALLNTVGIRMLPPPGC
jgi:hypothetical protein